MRFPPICLVAIAVIGFTGSLPAQAAPSPTPSTVDISGVMFGSLNIRTDSAARSSLGGERPAGFSIDRIYVNFKAPAGDNGAFRLTTDIFQNLNPATNGYYQGWAIRMKYAWFQYTGLRDRFGKGSSLLGRIGSIHNIVIDQVEGPWPRYLSPIAVERIPFFSSADVGAGGLLTLGNRMGEVYATVTNGPGYASNERDRFKDPAIRVTLTPLANRTGYIRSLYFMPWYYKGFVGSQFAAGGAGQQGPGANGAITEALTRDRWGAMVGIRDRRLTWGLDLAYQHDQSESGANTVVSPRRLADSTGRLIAGYAVFRPFEAWNPGQRSPFALIGRYDHLTPNTDPSAPEYAGTTPAYDYTVMGASYDVNQRFTLALDYQVDRPMGFPDPTGTNVRPRPRVSTLFLHWNTTF